MCEQEGSSSIWPRSSCSPEQLERRRTVEPWTRFFFFLGWVFHQELLTSGWEPLSLSVWQATDEEDVRPGKLTLQIQPFTRVSSSFQPPCLRWAIRRGKNTKRLNVNVSQGLRLLCRTPRLCYELIVVAGRHIRNFLDTRQAHIQYAPGSDADIVL